VTAGAASKSAPPPAWILDLIQANIAAKAPKPTPYGASPDSSGAQPTWLTQAKRDVGEPAAPAQPPMPVGMSPYPFFPPMPQFVPPVAPSGPAPAGYPMYPAMLPPFMPYWKLG